MLAPVGVVGEIEDVLPRGGQVGADGDPRCLGDSLASAVFSHHTRWAELQEELPPRLHVARSDRRWFPGHGLVAKREDRVSTLPRSHSRGKVRNGSPVASNRETYL